MFADNISEVEVVDRSGRHETKFRVQLVAPAEKLPGSFYDCEDRCITCEYPMLDVQHAKFKQNLLKRLSTLIPFYSSTSAT